MGVDLDNRVPENRSLGFAVRHLVQVGDRGSMVRERTTETPVCRGKAGETLRREKSKGKGKNAATTWNLDWKRKIAHSSCHRRTWRD